MMAPNDIDTNNDSQMPVQNPTESPVPRSPSNSEDVRPGLGWRPGFGYAGPFVPPFPRDAWGRGWPPGGPPTPGDVIQNAGKALFTLACTAPIDRIKILLQIQACSPQIQKVGSYQGMTDCFRRVITDQGYRSLYRGFSAKLLIHFPSQTLSYAMKDKYRKWFFSSYDQKKQYYRHFGANLMSGGSSAATVVGLFYPLNVLYTRLAADVGRTASDREFAGLVNCFSKIYSLDGIRGLYRGLLTAIQGVFIHRALYFGCFDTAKSSLRASQRSSFFIGIGMGQGIAFVAGIATYPFDTVMRHMMMENARKERYYAGTWDCWKKIYRAQGSRGFYRGLLPNLISGGVMSFIHVLLTWKRR